MILAWITDRLRESAGSKSLATNRDLTFQPTAGAMTKPHGPPPMPEKLPAVKLPQLHRKLPIVLMDASPWAPLVAVAGQEHVRLLHTPTHEELGVLPFPEGVPHVIRFSRDGTVLLVAGGKPVQSGKAVLFDVRSGKRLAEIGDELDAVLAADLSPDQQLVAIGSSGKIVKVYRTSDGLLKYKLTRHTDWITEIGFSPDGNKLATADRSGGLHLWKPKTGQGHRLFHSRVGQARFERRPTSGKRREIMVGRRDEAPLVPPYRFLRPNKAMALKTGGILLTLAEHKASVPSRHWRNDSRVLATGGEDGLLVWWDTVDGWPAISKPNAHPPKRAEGIYGRLRNGVLAASFDHNGNLLTAGRDQVVRLWAPGGQTTKSFAISAAIPVTACISHDGRTLICGDSLGELHF